MAANKKNYIDVNSFPPGSNRVFKELVIGTNQRAEEGSNLAQEAKELAQSAYNLADVQRQRNDVQDVTLALQAGRISDAETRLTNVEGRMTLAENDIDGLISLTADLGTRVSTLEAWRTYMTRQKSEVVYSGLSLVIPTTATNFFTLLNPLTPTSGNPLPFFVLSAGRLKALNKNLNLNVKFTLEGTFAGGVLTRSLAFVFGTTVPDTIFVGRNTLLASDSLNLNTFFSVEENDDITNPGITCTVQAIGAAFTCTRIKIIATQ